MTEHEDLIARLRAVVETALSDASAASSEFDCSESDYRATEAHCRELEAVRDELISALEKVTVERDNWKLSAEEAERAEKRWPISQGPIDDYRMGRYHGFIRGYIAGASRPVTDAEADAAQTAFHEYVVGADEPLTARDIGVARQAWKVAIQAARALADKETR